jgi:dipeptidyl-peptidase 4
VLVKPRAFSTRSSWPVLERIYGGPQINAQPRSFAEGLNGPFMHGLNALAEMGFVVAVLDGPGTPYRSKAFRDMTYGQADRWGVAHHRAALENAARTRPWMDLTCVGVSGHSYGGYGTVMAMLLEADFYQVGAASAGMYDLAWAYSGAVERYFGSPDFGGGRAVKESPAEIPERYRDASPSRYVDRLRGQLMIIYGDLDENIQPAGTLKLVDDLIGAGKSFDLLALPGRNHGFVPAPYYQKRLWDYFIEHVQGRKPRHHHKLAVQPGVRMFI